jgi:hypothetical protein
MSAGGIAMDQLGYLPVHRHHDEEYLDAIWRGER